MKHVRFIADIWRCLGNNSKNRHDNSLSLNTFRRQLNKYFCKQVFLNAVSNAYRAVAHSFNCSRVCRICFLLTHLFIFLGSEILKTLHWPFVKTLQDCYDLIMLFWLPRNFDGVTFNGGVLYKNSQLSTDIISRFISETVEFRTTVTAER